MVQAIGTGIAYPVKRIYYRDSNVVDSIVFYDKSVQCCSVAFYYGHSGDLQKQKEVFLNDRFLNREIVYKPNGEGLVVASSKPSLFFNANRIAALRFEDAYDLFDDISYDIENILFTVMMKNAKSADMLQKKMEYYRKTGNVEIDLPFGFSIPQTYSQYNLFTLDVPIDSVQIKLIDKRLERFCVYYDRSCYIKQRISYDKEKPVRIDITVKDDNNQERYYNTDFIYKYPAKR